MDVFISREAFGWTPQEAQMHMVTDYFSHSEWKVIAEVLGPNPRHLFELYALKQNNHLHTTAADRASTFEDIVDAYLAYLQVNYRIDYSEEIFDDPSALALLQVGLLYAQRDPPFFRPISRGIQRCLVRWLVQQRMELSFPQLIRFQWHRIIRGRFYRHLMVQVDSKY